MFYLGLVVVESLLDDYWCFIFYLSLKCMSTVNVCVCFMFILSICHSVVLCTIRVHYYYFASAFIGTPLSQVTRLLSAAVEGHHRRKPRVHCKPGEKLEYVAVVIHCSSSQPLRYRTCGHGLRHFVLRTISYFV